MAIGGGITGYLEDLRRQNTIFPLSGLELRIGRETYCEIRCKHTLAVSRCHAKLRFVEGKWHIENVSRNGTTVNGLSVPRADLVALNNGDLITLPNQDIAVFKFLTTMPTGTTTEMKTNGRIKKHVRIASRDDESQVEPEDPQPAGLVDETQIFNKRLLQATYGRNSLDLTRQRMQNLTRNQHKVIQDLQDEKRELQTQISELLEKLGQSEEKRKRTEMNLDATTNHNVELQENLDRMTTRNSEIQKILQDEAQCSICFQVAINGHETDCHHLFCEACVTEWREHGGYTCPLCRKVILATEESTKVNNIVRKLHSLLPEELQRERQLIIEERRQIQAQREQDTEDDDDELQLIQMEQHIANWTPRRINTERTTVAPLPAPRTQPENRVGDRPTRFEITRRQHHQTPYSRPSNQLARRNLQTSPDFILRH